jgi:RNA recognition motif-containing protein
MSRGGNYSQSKRQRETDKARKKQEKAERRRRKRERGPGEVEIVSAADVVGDLPSSDEALRNMEQRANASRSAAPIPCRLFVGGLSWETNETQLQEAFAEFGEVEDAVIVTDRDTGRSRGFGFVTMADRKDASRAIDSMNNASFNGRNIVVNVATQR